MWVRSLLFSEFINMVFVFYICTYLIMLLYTFWSIILIDIKNKQFLWFSSNNYLELLPAFTCAKVVGNLWSICLGVNILSPVPCFDLRLTSDLISAESSYNLITFPLDS